MKRRNHGPSRRRGFSESKPEKKTWYVLCVIAERRDIGSLENYWIAGVRDWARTFLGCCNHKQKETASRGGVPTWLFCERKNHGTPSLAWKGVLPLKARGRFERRCFPTGHTAPRPPGWGWGKATKQPLQAKTAGQNLTKDLKRRNEPQEWLPLGVLAWSGMQQVLAAQACTPDLGRGMLSMQFEHRNSWVRHRRTTAQAHVINL